MTPTFTITTLFPLPCWPEKSNQLHHFGGDYPPEITKAQDDGPNSHIPQIKLHLPKAGLNWGVELTCRKWGVKKKNFKLKGLTRIVGQRRTCDHNPTSIETRLNWYRQVWVLQRTNPQHTTPTSVTQALGVVLHTQQCLPEHVPQQVGTRLDGHYLSSSRKVRK